MTSLSRDNKVSVTALGIFFDDLESILTVVGSCEETVGGEMRGEVVTVRNGCSAGGVDLHSSLDVMVGHIGSPEVAGRARRDDDGKDEKKA